MSDFFYRVKGRVSVDAEWFIPLDEFIQRPEHAIEYVRSALGVDTPENYLSEHTAVIDPADVWLADEDGDQYPEPGRVIPAPLPTEAEKLTAAEADRDAAYTALRQILATVEELSINASRCANPYDTASRDVASYDEILKVIYGAMEPLDLSDGDENDEPSPEPRRKTPTPQPVRSSPIDVFGPEFRAAFERRLRAGSQASHDEATAAYRHLSSSVEALNSASLRVLESFDGTSVDELYTVIRDPEAPWNKSDADDD